MKKQLLKIGFALLILAATQAKSQCLTASYGQYPFEDYTPECLGGPETIVDDGYSGDYSGVNVTDGTTYTFSSSIASDVVTIGDEAGNVVLAFGTGTVTWTAVGTQLVRFYTHLDADCTEDSDGRARIVQCGVAPVCNNPIATLPYFQGFEDNNNNACLTFQDLNGGEDSGWAVDNIFPTESGTKSMVYTYDADLPGDDWFFTTGLPLTTGQTYTLTFKYRGGLGIFDYLENLEVKYGTSASAAGMLVTPLLTFPGIATSFDDDYTVATVDFTPATTGTFYIGFHATSDENQGYIQMDDVSLTTSLATNTFDNSAFTFYPNPVKDNLHFSYKEAITNISVSNLLGQTVFSSNMNKSEGVLDLSGVASGMYIVRLTAGKEVKTLKITKQ